MKIDLVLSGGGVKSYAFLGVLEAIENRKLAIKRTAGTSAGAILAAFLAAGYHRDQIMQMIEELDQTIFLDEPLISKYIPFSKWFVLYYKMGLYKGEQLEKWVYNQLAKKGIYTFSDLPLGYLKVIVSDLSLGKLIVIPDDLERVYQLDPYQFSVARAVRMSAGFPYFFMPVKLSKSIIEKSYIVDGGLLSNFPIWVFETSEKQIERPVLGVKLSESFDEIAPNKMKNAFDMLQALFSTMKQAHDSRYISKSEQNNIIFLPVSDVRATNFSISDTKKRQLIKIGQERGMEFLSKWPK
ncbi:patatin-like phospholipase family protein [Virgibacillus sp. W0430]|uniref:patatin-like phospholipase family protein n=1 Tax=Virgibacillus sp. W0430 TaxID=3391580 RepID=UPI003F47172F